ncbi:unnamed protein product, partial [Mesorhabditis spiculigera]
MYTQQFVATVGGLDVETNITFTVCSLHHNVTTADQAVEYDACTTNSDLMTVLLDCCSKTVAAYNGQRIAFDIRNLTSYSGAPIAFLIRLHDGLGNDEQPIVWTIPYNPADDEELNFRPHSTLDCDYNFYPGIVTSANQSVPLAIFRGTDNFYPQFLLTGAFTVEVPPKCQPTISFKGGQIITDALVIITECTGMRLVVAPGYNSLQMSPGDWTPMALTWSCSPAVNMTFELVDLLDSVLTVTIETENVTVERPHETSSTSRRFQQLAWFMTGCTETT